MDRRTLESFQQDQYSYWLLLTCMAMIIIQMRNTVPMIQNAKDAFHCAPNSFNSQRCTPPSPPKLHVQT